MASTIFDVTPEELEASANRIETKTTEFTKAYTSIYTAVTDLRVTFKGEASDTFNQRIEGYKNDFTAAEKAEMVQEVANEIDLTDYVKNTDYASISNGGVIKTSNSAGTTVSSGELLAQIKTYSNYTSASNNMFISKGTLENVLAERIGNIETILDTLDVGSGV